MRHVASWIVGLFWRQLHRHVETDCVIHHVTSCIVGLLWSQFHRHVRVVVSYTSCLVMHCWSHMASVPVSRSGCSARHTMSRPVLLVSHDDGSTVTLKLVYHIPQVCHVLLVSFDTSSCVTWELFCYIHHVTSRVTGLSQDVMTPSDSCSVTDTMSRHVLLASLKTSWHRHAVVLLQTSCHVMYCWSPVPPSRSSSSVTYIMSRHVLLVPHDDSSTVT